MLRWWGTRWLAPDVFTTLRCCPSACILTDKQRPLLFMRSSFKLDKLVRNTPALPLNPAKMMARLALFLALGFLIVGCSAAASAPAHKGKNNVSPVCAASGSAWKSKSACSSFETGICNTVEGCANDFITADQLDEYTTVIFINLRVKYDASAGDRKCTVTVRQVSPGAEKLFEYYCGVFEQGGVTYLNVETYCPSTGYLSSQQGCVKYNDGLTPPTSAYAIQDFSWCQYTLTDLVNAEVGTWLTCSRTGGPVHSIAAAGGADKSANDWRKGPAGAP